jgi:hypothetical protein
MTSLRELQCRILDAVLNDSSDAAVCLIDAPARIAAASLGVYRNTLHSNVVGALSSTYPAVRRLVGENYFRMAALEYIGRHPSPSGDLRHAGAGFPGYLAGRHADDEHRYLGDVARWELLIEDVLLAGGHEPLDLSRLRSVAPAAYDALRFTLHPGLRLFESPFPVRRIWESNVGSDGEPAILDLTSGGDRLAVLRQRLQLHFHRLSQGEWCLLRAFGRAERFAAAIEAAAACDEGFDPAVALQRFVGLGAIVGFVD